MPQRTAGATSMLVDRLIRRFEDAVCILTLAVIVVLVLAQIFYRYALSSGILWIDELVINLMVLMVLMGAALATRHGLHTDLRMIREAAPPPAALVLRLVGFVVTVAFVLTLVVTSARYAYDARRLSTTMIGIPLWLTYGSIPLGGLLILYELLKRAIVSIRDGWFVTDVAP